MHWRAAQVAKQRTKIQPASQPISTPEPPPVEAIPVEVLMNCPEANCSAAWCERSSPADLTALKKTDSGNLADSG